MKRFDVAGKTISQMSLGTVQLGMDYGISNNAGQPDEKQSFAMLSAALDKGVTAIDTARAYGESEEVLGRFFAQYKGRKPFINTKIARSGAASPKEFEKEMLSSMETSLEKLRLKKVDSVMLHSDGNLHTYCDKVAPLLEGLVKRGYADMVGASVYYADEVEKFLQFDAFQIIQVPMNLFDQRLIAGGWIQKLNAKNAVVCVRSVFLQGLFFMDPDRFTDPGLTEFAAAPLKKLRVFAEAEGMTVPEFAIAYIRDIEGVTSLVLGADTAKQVENNVGFFETRPISEKTRAAIEKEFCNVNMVEIMKVLSRPKTA